MYLGPTGRTKNTEDPSWPASRVKPWAPKDKPVSPTVAAIRELRQLRRSLSIMRWVIVAVMVAMGVWVIGVSIVDLVQAPERERRVRACAVAMDHQETLRGPVSACEPLSASERREAAYQYGQMRGLW